MLDLKINRKEGEFNIAIAGTLPDIMSEITYLLGVIYERLDKNKKLRNLFDDLLREVVDSKLYKLAFDKKDKDNADEIDDDERMKAFLKMLLKGLKGE